VEKAHEKSEQRANRLLARSLQLQGQLRHLSHQVLQVQEEERKRISRELHDEVLQTLAAAPNVETLEPCDDIDAILARTRVLLAPSLWPEAFGYVVVEAMLRGIPVLASDIGGLPEAKLGVPYLLPVAAARHEGGQCVSPAQDVGPWAAALAELLASRETYERCASESRAAALRFHAGIDVGILEQLLS
jgi:glycosyltransferase involved in cell wall biosynthesis